MQTYKKSDELDALFEEFRTLHEKESQLMSQAAKMGISNPDAFLTTVKAANAIHEKKMAVYQEIQKHRL